MKEKQINDEFEAWWICPPTRAEIVCEEPEENVYAPCERVIDDVYRALAVHGDDSFMQQKELLTIIKHYARLAFEGGVGVAVREYEQDGLA